MSGFFYNRGYTYESFTDFFRNTGQPECPFQSISTYRYFMKTIQPAPIAQSSGNGLLYFII